MKKRFTEEQIIDFLREAEAGIAIKDLCRRYGFSEASYYLWRSKFGGMSVPDAKRLKDLESENAQLKKLLAEQLFENDLIKDALRKKGDQVSGDRGRCNPRSGRHRGGARDLRARGDARAGSVGTQSRFASRHPYRARSLP
ncbi:hypothetical protein CFBP8129_22130 [Xanthomonas hortorum pv. gardneri]|uniref:IS3 family transposase IS1404 n=2 Tax=Xanthomonas hortorum TaxID=56454 RepID=A0A6V7DBH3_9XANT|nr:hypothetical protein CFBP2044_20740 [Xanthomonas hortorum pv. cynarae]CAD0328928.1 hypothetical protein CFBP2044_20740 [Xanthomonas hortorum pv. cynarae]CAD0331593.1 hypothetical protein CFBP8129_22130 [Xanthomonas hortorum pv. gardneri]CAD0331600.1 hypothetical protein CFBP8129_22130 [Xanthomonas hortorum pv. gardneri]CAH2708398.1 Transposase [Xanthomonas campestris pv. nigromaculans]